MRKPSTLLVLNSGPGLAGFNMALDELLLESAPQRENPVLRFYSWIEPAASFGYFQRFSEVERSTRLRPLVRRPTAGGIVPHDQDWTYSLVFPPSHGWYHFRAVESYRAVHTWLRTAFSGLELQCEVAPSANKSGAGQCFAGHEQFDLLLSGRKIAGAAQRRTRQGLLIQGSIQAAGLPAEWPDWEKAILNCLPDSVAAVWTSFRADERLVSRASELATVKYDQPAYNEKR